MPSICDPGEDLIKEVRSIGLNIIYTWTMRSNNGTGIKWIPSSKFIFEGFLPKRIVKEKKFFEISKIIRPQFYLNHHTDLKNY